MFINLTANLNVLIGYKIHLSYKYNRLTRQWMMQLRPTV